MTIKVSALGNIGRDPEMRYTENTGLALLKFSIGCKGRKKDTTNWLDVTIWGKQAEILQPYLTKGQQVVIWGDLAIEKYTTKEGENRQRVVLNADHVQMLGKKRDDDGTVATRPERPPASGGAPAPNGGFDDEFLNEDDIPPF